MNPDLGIIAGGPGDSMPEGLEELGGLPGGEAAAPAAPMASTGNEDCVPVDALSIPDDGDQMTPPAVGDMVTYTCEGKVSRVEGGKAFVERKAINGEPIEGEKPAEPELSPEAADAQGMAGLEDMARAQDGPGPEEGGY